MPKVEIDNKRAIFPKPAVLVGVMIDGKPNFMNLAWLTRISFQPHMWVMSIGKMKYTVEGIRSTRRFSINIPSSTQVVELDYCGITSGRDVDKSKMFTVIYGQMRDVPMIEECPVCYELEVYEIREQFDRAIVIGEVKHAYADEECLTNDEVDQMKLNQLIYTAPPGWYWTLGDKVAQGFSIGKTLQVKRET